MLGSAFCEEVVRSTVGEKDIGYKVGCTVEAEVFGATDGAEVIVSLVVLLVLRVYVGLLV